MDIEWIIQIGLFTTFTVIGVVATTVNFYNALKVADWLRFTGLDGSRLIVARGSLVTSSVYLLCQIVFLSISIVGIMHPPRGGPVTNSATSSFISWAIILTQLLLAVAAIAGYVARNKLLKSISDDEKEQLLHDT